jgi:DNA-binding CsgD family transcriptional regulator
MDQTFGATANDPSSELGHGKQPATDPVDRQWRRLFEAVERLSSEESALVGEDERHRRRLHAVVVDIGSPSPLSQRRLQALQEHFPNVTIFAARARRKGGPNAQRGTDTVKVLAEFDLPKLGLPGTSSQPVESVGLDSVVRSYASHRGLSPRQSRILELHLSGKHDKEIANQLGCEQSTIYEHWRRMARKVSGSQKRDLVADFHRYLALPPTTRSAR